MFPTIFCCLGGDVVPRVRGHLKDLKQVDVVDVDLAKFITLEGFLQKRRR